MNRDLIKTIIKTNKITKGFKISEAAITHIEHMIKLLYPYYDMDLNDIAIVFYALGNVTGKLEN